VSHPNQRAFVEACAHIAGSMYPNAHVAEIGSYAVNDSIRRYFAWASEYIGVDLVAGPGVDVVMQGHEFGESNTFDAAISCEVFEHNPAWLETFVNMIRIVRPGGLVLFTCATTGRLEHGTARTDPALSPGTSNRGWQYYRNLTCKDFRRSLDLSSHFAFHRFFHVARSHDLFFVGLKHKSGLLGRDDAPCWLAGRIVEIETVVRSLGEAPREKMKFPLLHAARSAPLLLASHCLPDRHYQDFAFHYWKWSAALRKLLVGRGRVR
jgi:SAM-dependent methyltransferase